ncbi:hypothetical protein ACJCHP_002541 [Enterobacter asburiae]
MTETVEAKPNFDQAASPLKGIKNIITPSGVVMRVAAVDLQWFNHFYTFEAQGKKCYQSIKTIAKEMGRAVSVAQERIDKLQALGLLDVGKEPYKDGWRNTYTCTPIDIIVSRMTDAPVTPQVKPLKKSQLNSLLKKSGQVDPRAVNRGIKVMAKTIANRDLSDEEAMQFAFQIATEKLAALGWNIETLIEERNDQDEQQPVTDAPETAAPVAGVGEPLPVVDAGNNADLSGSNHSVMNDQPEKGSNDNGRPAWFRAAFKGNGDLVPEAKAWARLRGATSEEEEKHEIWRALEIINPLLDSQSKPQPEPQPQPSDPSTAADEEEEESADYPF